MLAIAATLCCALGFTACNNGNGSESGSTNGGHSHSWSQTYTEDGDRHY